MIFFFKKKPIVLDCFTSAVHAHKYAKIDHAKKFIPEWWKELPLTYEVEGQISDSPTMKRCLGFINQFKNGVMLPLWSELLVEIGPIDEFSKRFRWKFADGVSSISHHPQQQRGNYLPSSHYQHAKICSPWHFRCNRDVQWQYLMNPYVFKNTHNYNIIPGIVDYYYQTNTHINVIFKRTEKFMKYKFDHGQPMVQMIPLSEDPIQINTHLVTDKELERLESNVYPLSFTNLYNTTKKARIKAESEKKKCPFSFK